MFVMAATIFIQDNHSFIGTVFCDDCLMIYLLAPPRTIKPNIKKIFWII